MRTIAAYMTILLLTLLPLSAGAQNYTTFSKAVISFDSFPQGAEVLYRGECVGRTPCTVTLQPSYQIESDQTGSEDMTAQQIQAANSVLMEREIAESGEESGVFSRFSMDVELKIGEKSVIKTIPLLWSPGTVLGMPARNIHYQSEVSHVFGE